MAAASSAIPTDLYGSPAFCGQRWHKRNTHGLTTSSATRLEAYPLAPRPATMIANEQAIRAPRVPPQKPISATLAPARAKRTSPSLWRKSMFSHWRKRGSPRMIGGGWVLQHRQEFGDHDQEEAGSHEGRAGPTDREGNCTHAQSVAQTSSLAFVRSMTSSVNSVVPEWPPRSAVRTPCATASSAASRTARAASSPPST